MPRNSFGLVYAGASNILGSVNDSSSGDLASPNAPGISRTMAQVHALLIISREPLCADQIMSALKISRGNVNLNIHSLIDWGLVQKVLKPGDRKDYFAAEKDVMLMMKQIIMHRKRKERDPMVKVRNEISCG